MRVSMVIICVFLFKVSTLYVCYFNYFRSVPVIGWTRTLEKLVKRSKERRQAKLFEAELVNNKKHCNFVVEDGGIIFWHVLEALQ